MIEEHNVLVEEMDVVASLPIEDRLLLAKNRRLEQIKAYCNRMENLEKLDRAGSEGKGIGSEGRVGWEDRSRDAPDGPRHRRAKKHSKRNVKFTDDVTLFEAASRNDLDEVRRLVTSDGCSPNATNRDGLTLVHKCCVDGLEDLLRLLVVELKADLQRTDDELWTPLHTAALCHRASICRMLIENGADLLALTVDGNMPYDVCDDEESLDIIESAMAERNVTQELIDSLRGKTEQKMLYDLQVMFSDGLDIDVRGCRGETPLHIAAANGYLLVANFLLTDGSSSPDVIDDEGWQPIHCAAYWRQLAMLELLLIHGADPEALTDDKQTALDLVNDADMRVWMKTVKEELVKNLGENSLQGSASTQEVIKTVSTTKINSSSYSVSGSIYSSNVSLAEKSSLGSSNKWLSSKDKEALTKRETRSESSRWHQSAPSLHVIDESFSDEPTIQSATEKKREQRTQNRNSANDVRPSELTFVPDKPTRNIVGGGRTRIISASTSDVTSRGRQLSPAVNQNGRREMDKELEVHVNSNHSNSCGLEAHLSALSRPTSGTAAGKDDVIAAGSDVTRSALKSCISTNNTRPGSECRPQQRTKKNMFKTNCCQIM